MKSTAYFINSQTICWRWRNKDGLVCGVFWWLSTSRATRLAWVMAGDGSCQEEFHALFGSCLSFQVFVHTCANVYMSHYISITPFNLPPPLICLAHLFHTLPALCHQLLIKLLISYCVVLIPVKSMETHWNSSSHPNQHQMTPNKL